MVSISPPVPIQGALVGSSQIIYCTVTTVFGVESSSVLIIWTGPLGGSGGGSGGGAIINGSRVMISLTTSSGNEHFSSIQFTYLMEGDEGTYTCNVMILDTIASQSVELWPLISKLFTHVMQTLPTYYI